MKTKRDILGWICCSGQSSGKCLRASRSWQKLHAFQPHQCNVNRADKLLYTLAIDGSVLA